MFTNKSIEGLVGISSLLSPFSSVSPAPPLTVTAAKVFLSYGWVSLTLWTSLDNSDFLVGESHSQTALVPFILTMEEKGGRGEGKESRGEGEGGEREEGEGERIW